MSEALQDKLGYRFKDVALLKAALTHPSLHQGKKIVSDYERLEFLGDRVLALVIAEWLYELFPKESEGSLAKRHAALVNRDALALVAEALELGKELHLVNQDDLQRGRVNILSDAVEALIGAMYRDDAQAGLDKSRSFIRVYWNGLLEMAVAVPQDAKSALQEWAQGRGLPLPQYDLVESSGPAHAPHYIMRVSVRGMDSLQADGSSKREAEKKAAALMLEKIKNA